VIDIDAINLGRREALLTDGSVVPITNLIDADGDDAETAAAAVGLVCGVGGLWFFAMVNDFASAGPKQ